MTRLFNQIMPHLTGPVRRAEGAPAEDRGREFTVKPAYELTEAADAWALTVHLPGVAKEGLEFTAEEGVIRMLGRRAWQRPSDWTPLYRESVDAPFELVLEHDHAVDVEKIRAELKEGVLRASLPKAEALKPRKIAVT
jgi:HSP20 family protein